MSAQLKLFEENLGVRLFEREHRKLILTEQGKIALEYAKSIFESGNEMCEVLQDGVAPNRLNVQIGALDSIPKKIILDLSKMAYELATCSIFLKEGRIEGMFIHP